MKIRIILYEKGIEFEKHEIHTKSQGEELKRLNPRAEVPALVDGGSVICDSKVIAEYLEETRPEPALLPKDPVARAQCRGLELIADTEIDAAVIAFSMFKFFRPGLVEEQPDAFEKAEAGVRRHYAALEKRFDGGEYLLGTFSRADIAFVPHLGACAFMGLPPGDDTPQLAAWHARMNERESVQRISREAQAALGERPDDPFFDNDRLHWRGDRIEQLVRIGMGPWLLEELAADRGFVPPGP